MKETRRTRPTKRRLEAEGPVAILRRLAPYGVLVPKAREVKAYLATHLDLARLLPNIVARVRRDLEPQVELSLEVYKDPEVDDRYLALYVRKERYESDILERLQSVSQHFNRRLEEVPGYFLLTTDFSRARDNHDV